MWDSLRWLFDSSGFLPRQETGSDWTPELMNVHVVSDTMAATAFLAVCAFLIFLLLRQPNRHVPRRVWLPVLLLAVAGLMHVMEVWQFWWPAYRFAAVLKLTAAVVSWATLLSFIPFVSRMFSGGTWGDLQVQITRRQEVEQQLR